MSNNNALVVIYTEKNKSTKLVEGCEYLATNLYGAIGDKIRFVQIQNIGCFNSRYFTLPDGTPLNTLDPFSIENKNIRVKPSLIDYTGQYVRCSFSTSKYIKENEIYYVESQFKNNLASQYYADFVYSFKLKNIKHSVASYRFYEIPLSEQRNLKLKSLNNEIIKTGTSDRKFLLYNEKERNIILLNIFTKSLIDINNIYNITDKKNTIIKIMMKKGKKYNILEEEIILFFNNDLDKIINT